MRDLDAGETGRPEMQGGITIAEHYSAEALRLSGTSRVSTELRLAKALLRWLLNEWNEPAVSLPDIYQRGPNVVRDRAMASKLVALLEEHNWVRRIKQGAKVAGQQRRDAWKIWSK
jgi:hypothetical protein